MMQSDDGVCCIGNIVRSVLWPLKRHSLRLLQLNYHDLNPSQLDCHSLRLSQQNRRDVRRFQDFFDFHNNDFCSAIL